MKVPRFVTKLGEALVLESEEQVRAFVRGYLERKLRPLTPALLSDAIIHNKPLVIASEKKAKEQRVVKNVLRSKTARKLWEQHQGQINAGTILLWWKEDRPDLFGVVFNWPDRELAVRYMDEQIDTIKREIFSTGTAAPPAPVEGQLVLKGPGAPVAPDAPQPPAQEEKKVFMF